MGMKHPAVDPHVRRDRLQRLEQTHDLLMRVRAEHADAFNAAVRACSLAEVAKVLGISRAGVQYYRDQIRAGATLRRPPEGKPTTKEQR
jgi:predicted transcriptional regulator